jgi:uncharacterized protein
VTDPTSAGGLEPGAYVGLFYDYVEDMAERRAPHRDAHLTHIRRAKEAGVLVNAGALTTGAQVEGGFLVFAPGRHEAAEQFATDDPYVTAGLVASRRTVIWNVVL